MRSARRLRFLWILNLFLSAGYVVLAAISDSLFGTVLASCLAVGCLAVAVYWFRAERRIRTARTSGDDELH